MSPAHDYVDSMLAVVTGGAGFIGSNIVDALIARGDDVRVLDDVTTGYEANIASGADVIRASVDDLAAVRKAVAGADVIFHQAAHRAVLRSVENPLETDSANVHGTLTLLKCAADEGVKRFVYASSSSVYGGASERPTPETAPLLPRSPYAVTKLAGEHYCRVFAELFGLETVALRYFNVFGPRQRPDSAYAAVIPLFIEALRKGEAPIVHGDGKQTRDFTFVTDAVAANLAAASAPADQCSGRAYNVAGGMEVSILDVLEQVASLLGVDLSGPTTPTFTEPRAGDVRHSCAEVEAARRDLGHSATVGFEDGLRRTVDWFTAV